LLDVALFKRADTQQGGDAQRHDSVDGLRAVAGYEELWVVVMNEGGPPTASCQEPGKEMILHDHYP
jgi:hypothetical protein